MIIFRAEFLNSARVAKMGPGPLGLLSLLLFWSDGQQADGVVPAVVLDRLPGEKKENRRLLSKLEKLGEVTRTDQGDVEITHWRDHARSKQEITNAREDAKERKRTERANKGRTSESSTETVSVTRDVSTASQDVTPSVPYRTVPDPSPSRTVPVARTTDGDLVDYLRSGLAESEHANRIDHLDAYVAIASKAPRPQEVLSEAIDRFVANRGPMGSPGGILRKYVQTETDRQIADEAAKEARRAERKARADAEAADAEVARKAREAAKREGSEATVGDTLARIIDHTAAQEVAVNMGARPDFGMRKTGGAS